MGRRRRRKVERRRLSTGITTHRRFRALNLFQYAPGDQDPHRGGARGLSEAMRAAETRPYGWLVRTAAVLVGLANLVVLVDLFGGSPVARGTVWGTVSLYEALPPFFVVVVAGLLTSEVVLRGFGHLIVSGGFSRRYAVVVGAVCAGAPLAGVLLSGVFVLQGTLGSTDLLTPAQRIPAAAYTAALGAQYGALLGLLEGLLLAFPLAAALGRFGKGGSPVRS